MSQDEIASIFNESSGRAYYMSKNAKSYNQNKILDNLDYLNKFVANIKTGKAELVFRIRIILFKVKIKKHFHVFLFLQ